MNSGKNKRYKYNKDKFRTFVPDNYTVIDAYSLSDLPAAVHIIKEQGINLLMVNGGDGTLQRLVTAMINSIPEDKLPIILPLRGGTSNMISGNLGVRKTPLDTVKILMDHLESYDRGQETLSTLPVKPLKITDKEHGIRYGFSFTNGLIYKVQQLFNQQENPTFRTVVNLITTTIGGYTIGSQSIKKRYSKISADIIIDGKRYPEDKYLLTIASPFQKLLLWFRPFHNPDAKGADRFYFIATAADPWLLIRNLRTFTTGKEVPPRSFNDTASQVIIRADSGYAFDGELVEDKTTDIKIEQGPAMKFLVVPETVRTSYGITYRTYFNESLVSMHRRDGIAPVKEFEPRV
jgi:diacylglycerol kinase family enzyme